MSDVSLGMAHEAEITLRKAGATSENFWNPVAKNQELARRVVTFVATATRAVFNLAAKIDRDMTGWTCIEPVEAKEGEFEPTLAEFLRPGKSCRDGEEMIKRANEQSVLTGLRHAEAMFRDQDRIPADWRKYYLVFPEVWQSPHGYRDVFCLYWGDNRWFLDYFWTAGGFDSSGRLVASRKYLR